MNRIILDRRDLSLEYATDCIIIRSPDRPPRTVPLRRVTQVICLHSVGLTTQLIGQLQGRGIDLIVMNQRHHQFSFSLFADETRSVQRRCAQYEFQQNETVRLELVKAICAHKFRVINRLVGDSLAGNMETAHPFDALREASSEQQIRGVEGALQQKLFQYWRARLPSNLGFKTRERRPPPDPVNALLSLTYVIVHNAGVRQAIAAGLDSRLGFYHRISHGRHSLACDIMEPVRPLIERWAAHLFINGELGAHHFKSSQQGCFLGKAGRQHYYALLENEMPDWEQRLKAGYRWLARFIDTRGQAHAV